MATKPIYVATVTHPGLGKIREIRGSDFTVVQQKGLEIKRQWNLQWQKKEEVERRTKERKNEVQQKALERQTSLNEKKRVKENSIAEKERQQKLAQQYKEERIQEAQTRDNEAKEDLASLRDLLSSSLTRNNAINWNKLKDKRKYSEPVPTLELPNQPTELSVPRMKDPEPIPAKPIPCARPVQPDPNSSRYKPSFGFLDKIFASRKKPIIAACEMNFQNDQSIFINECDRLNQNDLSELKRWEGEVIETEGRNSSLLPEWERAVEDTKLKNAQKQAIWNVKCEKAQAAHKVAMEAWEQHKIQFLEQQKQTNDAIDQSRSNYKALESGAISDYCDTVLTQSSYPDFFPKEWDLDYNASNRTLVIDYILPSPENFPTLKEVSYTQSKDDYKESYLSEKEREALFESTLYQIALRTIHEQFEADSAKALDAVAFNGVVTTLNKATGHKVTSCILSVIALKPIFLEINLADVDPKACFKTLKGVAASKLAGLSAVSPVITFDKSDRRFVASYGVADNINELTNLATMDWEDFEHLVRELFEQEFAIGGGEVRVTQASRDGGVDAIAFDPDPIRGGKIVIQAKRYANTVGVSAVRDLYGTVMNEGAIKGLLVSTADYGPDAYEFVKGKPLTLLNGSNLLHLLEKHGHKARINLNEAKQENKVAQASGVSRLRGPR